MKNKPSVFSLEDKTGILEPHAQKIFNIACNPDEIQRFIDILIFSVREGTDAEITLKCRGKGNTSYTKENISEIDMGTL